MAHPAQQKFFSEITKRFEDLFRGSIRVLEVGSQNINGTVRGYFPNAIEYLGIDIGSGQDVDWVVPGELLQLPDAWADIVVTTECLEHCKMWEEVFLNMIRMLRPSGLFLMTCASTGRATHGTLDSDEYSSPFTTSYYKNLGADDIAEKIMLGEFFEKHSFEVESISGDLYFWGIRNANEFKECLNSWLPPLDRLARAQGQLAQAVSLHAAICNERDAAIQDKDAAQQTIMELQQQLAAQFGTLQQAQETRDELTAYINTLEAQLKMLNDQRQSTVARLQRLRHQARPTGQAS